MNVEVFFLKYNVQPLKSDKEISDFYKALGRTRHSERNQFLFLLGINTGLRMSDLVRLRIRDVRGRDVTVIEEKKTGKARTLYLGQLKQELNSYLNKIYITDDDYLFQSQCSDSHLTVGYVYKLFQKIANQLERDDIGTHTLRKTFGYHYYQQTKDIGTLMMILNHSNESITKRYIGITDDEIIQSLQHFKIG